MRAQHPTNISLMDEGLHADNYIFHVYGLTGRLYVSMGIPALRPISFGNGLSTTAPLISFAFLIASK
jgi:hypothetical protein